MANDAKRPLFHRFQNREAYSPKASAGGKRTNEQAGASVFAEVFALNNPLGTYWADYAQSEAIELSVDEDAEIGGCDRVKIIASGDAITLSSDYTWTNVGSEEISTVADDENIIMVCMVSDTEIEYAVKVV
jgi:hypothetical protein